MHSRIPRRVIASLTAEAFDTNLETLRSPSRVREHSIARFAVWHLLYEFRPELSPGALGKFLNKDRTTVLHGFDRAKEYAACSRDFVERLDRARRMISLWRPDEAQTAKSISGRVPVAKKIETPPAAYIGAVKQCGTSPEMGNGFEYDTWFRNSCKKSEERFLRLAMQEHPERVRVPQKEAAE